MANGGAVPSLSAGGNWLCLTFTYHAAFATLWLEQHRTIVVSE